MSLPEKHPDWDRVLPTYSPAALAETLGDLKYDQLAEFLGHLSTKIAADAQKDRSRGRAQLALALYRAANHIQSSAEAIDKAWDVCAPYMPPSGKGPAPGI